MFHHETEGRSGQATSQSHSVASTENHTSSIDIGIFIDRYHRLLHLLYPFRLFGIAILYVIRWENYFLTLTVLLGLCVLFYYPAFLAGVLVAMAIVGMAVGKYYSQTKINFSQRKKEGPHMVFLNEDQQALKRLKKEEKAAHRNLIEYRQIICTAESHIMLVSNALDYLYRIVLWKSLEASVCVTILLCVVFALLCTTYLRVLSASLPFLVLCFNKYFLTKTVELWKRTFHYLYMKVRLKKKMVSEKETSSGTSGDKLSTSGLSGGLLHHQDHPSAASGLPTTSEHTAGAVPGAESEDVGAISMRSRSATVPSSTSLEANGSLMSHREGQSKDPTSSNRGFCNKCHTSFAKLLKRRHDCNYCGQSFCGSCTVKVKRAELGATSPAAFEESVRVCMDCKQRLDDLKLQLLPTS